MHLIGVHVIGAVHVIGPPVKDVLKRGLRGTYERNREVVQ